MGVVKRHLEEVWDRGWEDLNGDVCSACLADEVLRQWINQAGYTGTCSFCGAVATVITGNDLMERLADGLAFEWGDADNEGIPYDGLAIGVRSSLLGNMSIRTTI